MKTITLPQAALAALVAWTLAAPLSPSAQGGLVGHWKFDEGSGVTAADSAGANPGTINGATYIPGKIGAGALEFIGINTNDYVVIGGTGTALELTGTGYTIAWWQRWLGPNPSLLFGSTPVQRVINLNDNTDHSAGYSISLGGGADGDGTVILSHDNGADQNWNTGLISSTNWQHLAVVWDGTNRTLYADGYAFASRPTTGDLATDSDDLLVLGAYPLSDGSFGQFFNGDLDEVRIYDHALTPEEVRALGPTTPTPAITITQHPLSATVRTNGSITFTVAAYVTGVPSGQLSYQWQKNGANIGGATGASYAIASASVSDGGNYRVVLSQGGVSQPSSEAVLKVFASADEAMIAHWTFDEGSGTTARDSVGGFDGALVGGVTYIAGKIGSGALQFDGVDGHVEVGGMNSVLELVDTPYTVSWWAQAESGVRMINMDEGENYSGGYAFLAFFGGSFGWTHNSNNKPQNWNPGYFPVLDWQLMTAVWDGTNRTFYVDGVVIGAIATTGNLTSDHDDPLWFAGIPNYGQYLKGALDDIRFYNIALTPDDIAALLPEPPIIIVRQPNAVAVRATNGTVTLTVEAKVFNDKLPASGLRYQWWADGLEIAGATSASYTTPILNTPGAPVRYQVVVSHPQLTKTVTSREVPVTVLENLTPTLIGYWKFDEGSGTTALDSAGTHNGTINGAAYIPGRIGDGALDLNGQSSYVEIQDSIGSELELVDQAYTIAWWQRSKGPLGRFQRIINMDNGNDFNGGYSLTLSGGGTYFSTHNSGPNNNWDSGVRASTNWQHVAWVWDRYNRTLYVDGVAVASSITQFDLLTRGADPLWFGGMPVHGQFYAGALDEVRIYRDALSSDEIKALVPPLPIISITRQPANQTVRVGSSATFTASATVTGAPTNGLAYQWQKNGANIAGATAADLTIASATVADRGAYRVLVTETVSGAKELSREATLAVVEDANAALIGRWAFDEGSGTSATDSAGTHNGTIHDAAYITGKVGSGALLLNGTNSYVEINGATGSGLELAGARYTVSWWQRWDGPNGKTQRIINMDNGNNFGGGYAFGMMGSSFFATHNNGIDQNWQPGFTPATNWQHLAVAWDGTNRTLYVDGLILAVRSTINDITSRGNDVLWFGGIPVYGQYYAGAVDDIRYYSIALTQDEIVGLLPEPPVAITRQPASVTARQNQPGPIALNVEAGVYNVLLPASGLRYQWQKDGVDIAGATGASYNPSLAAVGSARYRVVISHTQLTQSKTSQDAIVTVLGAATPVMVGHWTFDEGSGTSANDSAGTHHGTIHDASYVAGKVGSGALWLNGTNSYVDINGATGSTLELAGTRYTVAWWQQWAGPNGKTQRIINMDNGESFSGGYAFALLGGGSFVATHNYGANQNWQPGFIPSTNWQHLAVVWDGFNRTLYINGALFANQITPSNIVSRGNDVLWFGAIPKYGQYFAGALDDIRIYSDALATAEIGALAGPAIIENKLTITQPQTGKIMIAWPVSATVFMLEEADKLVAPVWSTVGQSPQVVGDSNTITLDVSSVAKFYRLRSTP